MLKKFRRSRAHHSNEIKSATATICEGLENRLLFDAAVVGTQGPILAHPSAPATDSIDLSSSFTNSTLAGTLVEFQTIEGPIDVQLTDTATPKTVANFLSYVKSGAYDNTFFHRNAVLSTNAGGSPTTPADIVQGGGFKVVNNTPVHIATNAPVADEFTTESFGDIAGTLAMAKTSSANSATSEFYFNVHDNSAALDTPKADSSGVNTSFTAFGKILGNGLNVIDALAALPTVAIGSNANVPVVNIPAKKVSKSTIRSSNLAFLDRVSVVTPFTFTVASDNPAVVHPVINGNTLSFQYASGKTGVAVITVTANSVDGTTAQETFTVTVPNTAAPAATVTATADSQTVTSSVASSLHPLQNDTDSLAALQPSTLTVVTPPQHGTATPNTVTGAIVYNPTTGYTGPDSFTYTIADTAGTVSTPATFSLTVAAAATQITIGSAASKELVFVQPNGAVGRLRITNGTAVITFTSSDVQSSTKKGIVSAKGTGATISSIAITNTGSLSAKLDLSSSGVVTVGSITDTGSVGSIDAPRAQLTGALNVGGLGSLVLGSAQAATLTIGNGITGALLDISTASDTSIAGSASIKRIVSRQWLNTDGLDDTIVANNLTALSVAGEFADSVILSDANATLQSVRIGGNLTGDAWMLQGNLKTLTAKSALASWSLTAQGAISSVQIRGDLAGSITAKTIDKISVGGAMHDNSIVSTFPTPSGLEIRKITVGGGITNSKIISSGIIGEITAASMTTSQIDAGIDPSLTNNRTLASVSSDFVQPAIVTSVHINGLFSNSVIAAAVIRQVKLGNIQTTSDGLGNGIAGVNVGLLSGALSSGGRVRVVNSRLKTAAAALHSFSVNLVT